MILRQLVEKKLMANNSKSVKRVQTLIKTIKHLSNQLKAEKEKSRLDIACMMERGESYMNDAHSLSLVLIYKEKELETEKEASLEREKTRKVASHKHEQDCYKDAVADERAWSLRKLAIMEGTEEGRANTVVASGKFQFGIVCNTWQFVHANLI